MRLSIILAACALAGCAGPSVNVKEKWFESVANYAFVPLYPMREDVYVGDIRIHRTDFADAKGLNSRFVDRIDVGIAEKEAKTPVYAKTTTMPERKDGVGMWKQSTTAGNIFRQQEDLHRLRLMALPKIDVVRITKADAKASGLFGLWNVLVSGDIEDEENLLISLTGLETTEISDVENADKFLKKVKGLLDNEQSLTGICAAAKAMGDPEFEKTAISLVTRVAYARGVEYSYGDNFAASLRGSISSTKGDKEVDGGAGVVSEKSLGLNEIYEYPMAFGVDALMIDPRLVGANLAQRCKALAGAIIPSPVR